MGTALTLRKAGILTLSEPTGQPTIEEQAFCCAKRYGRQGIFRIYRFLCTGDEGVDVGDTLLARGENEEPLFERCPRTEVGCCE